MELDLSLFGKKTKRAPLKTLKVELGPQKVAKAKSGAKPAKAKQKAMDFAAWVDQYVEMSKGNPV